jgi:shikimate dehydrogenase
MLLYQGGRALEIWTGRPAPIAVMRRALEENVYGK